MTKQIIHAIKKFLRVGVIVATVTSGSINASAEGTITGLCSVGCHDQLNVFLDGSGYVLIEPVMVCAGWDDEKYFSRLDQVMVEVEGSSSVYLEVTRGEHTVATTSTLLDYSFINQNVKYKLIKYNSNGIIDSCWGNILIEDKMKPNLVCSDLIINCTESTAPDQLANSYNNSIPSATDNCGTPTLTFQDFEENYNCSNPDFLKKIKRVWTATDGSGNQKTCTQDIFIEKAEGAIIQFPAHLNNTNVPDLDNSNADLEPLNAGYPTLYGVNIGDQDLCNFSSSYQDQIINDGEGSFSILRNWIIVDWCTNDIFTHPQIINGLDEVVPIINYKENTTIFSSQ